MIDSSLLKTDKDNLWNEFKWPVRNIEKGLQLALLLRLWRMQQYC